MLDSWPVYPASDDPRDVAAAKEADGFRNRLFFDPVLRGRYPEDVLELLEPRRRSATAISRRSRRRSTSSD